jgi:hypothetical protein
MLERADVNPAPMTGSRADRARMAAARGRPGRMAAWVFRYEDRGERIKR